MARISRIGAGGSRGRTHIACIPVWTLPSPSRSNPFLDPSKRVLQPPATTPKLVICQIPIRVPFSGGGRVKSSEIFSLLIVVLVAGVAYKFYADSTRKTPPNGNVNEDASSKTEKEQRDSA